MKKIKVLALSLITSLTIISCSSDDSSTTDELNGEIVSIELRDEALTGVAPTLRVAETPTQKWWEGKYSKEIYSECDDSGEYEEELSIFKAYTSNGEIYTKTSIDGYAEYQGDWEWEDGSKTSIYDEDLGSTLEITFLNDGNLVLFYSQPEQMGRPSEDPCNYSEYYKYGTPHNAPLLQDL